MSSEFPEELITGDPEVSNAEAGVDEPDAYGADMAASEFALPDGVTAEDPGAANLTPTDAADKGFGELSKAVVAGYELDTDAPEGADGESAGVEPSDDLTYQYGRMVVALADAHAKAVIEEDVVGEQRTSEQLAQELASLREDFATWEAGLEHRVSDEYDEATGVISHFNELDRPHLPVTLADAPADVADKQGKLTSEVLDPEIPEQPDAAADPNLFTWLRGLSDERLVNYLQWSEARTNAVSEALLAQRETIKQNVREDFDHLITEGLAPGSARDALEQGFEYTTRFGALGAIESGFNQALGVFSSRYGRIGVKRTYDASEVGKYTDLSHKTLFHEDLHALDAANDMGLIYLESEEEEPLTWFNEAVKEHLSLAATNGQSYVVDPGERSDLGSYADVRELLHLVMTGGDSEIDISEVTAANFERRGTEGSSRRELADRLRTGYQERFPDLPPGETVLHVIAKEINAAPSPLQDYIVEKWILRMNEWRGVKLTNLSDMEEPTERAGLSITVG